MREEGWKWEGGGRRQEEGVEIHEFNYDYS
jgi:hypothetical protein